MNEDYDWDHLLREDEPPVLRENVEKRLASLVYQQTTIEHALSKSQTKYEECIRELKKYELLIGVQDKVLAQLPPESYAHEDAEFKKSGLELKWKTTERARRSTTSVTRLMQQLDLRCVKHGIKEVKAFLKEMDQQFDAQV